MTGSALPIWSAKFVPDTVEIRPLLKIFTVAALPELLNPPALNPTPQLP